MQVELSRALFPVRVVSDVVKALRDAITVESLRVLDDKITVQIEDATDQTGRKSDELFQEALTEALLRENATLRKVVSPDLWKSGNRHLDLTLRVSEDALGARVILAANTASHSPREVVEALAPLRGKTRMFLQSTNPVDRAVVVMYPLPGMEVSEMIATAVARLAMPG